MSPLDASIVSSLETKDESLTNVFFPKHKDESIPFVEGYIYIVKGSRKERTRSRKRKSSRYDWTYWGKQFGLKNFIFSNLILDINIHPNTTGSRVEEELFTTWLNKDEQGMDKHWRRKRFGKHPDRWFKVPVKTTVKQSLRNVDGDDVPRKRNKVIVVNDHKCVTGCLLLCVHYMGLRKHTEQMKKLLNKNLLFEQVLSKFQQAKGFVRHRVVDPFNFKPVVDTDPESLYVVQLSSQCDGNPESKDNFHCVSIFNKLIFDNNIETPLPLSKENLDKCCVGGPSYVFHHCSRVVRFTPTEKKKKLIVKNLSQQNTL